MSLRYSIAQRSSGQTKFWPRTARAHIELVRTALLASVRMDFASSCLAPEFKVAWPNSDLTVLSAQELALLRPKAMGSSAGDPGNLGSRKVTKWCGCTQTLDHLHQSGDHCELGRPRGSVHDDTAGLDNQE